MNSISTAQSGIQAAAARLDNAAKSVAIFYTPGFCAPEPPSGSPGAGVGAAASSSGLPPNGQASNIDLSAQMAELIVDTHSVAIAASVIHAQDAMTKSLLDVKA